MLRIKPSFVLYLLVLSYLNPNDVFYPFLLAAALHEGAHLLALRVLGKRALSLTLSFAEAELKTEMLTPWEELAVCAAGPAANFLCAASFRGTFSHFAAVSFLLGGVNLLPILPLDGGRMLRAVLELIVKDRAEKWMGIISTTLQIGLIAVLLHLCFYCGIGTAPLWVLAALAAKQKNKLLFHPFGDKI